MNRAILTGRITANPELRRTQNGTAVVSFTLAVNRISKDEETDFINCVAWNQTAELMEKYVSKGDLLGVEGRIQVRNYESNGKKVYVTEVMLDRVEFLQPKKESNATQPKEAAADWDDAGFNIDDEDLPF